MKIRTVQFQNTERKLLKRVAILSAAVIMAGTNTGIAQHMMGMATSERSVMNSMYLNPSGLSGSHEKIVVSLFSMQLYADNSLGTISKLFDINKPLEGNSTGLAFSNSGNKTFNLVAPAFELRGPSLAIGFNDKLKQSFAITTRIRGMNQLNNFDQSLYNTITDPNYISDGTYRFNTSKFNWTAHIWNEIGFSYAATVLNKGNSVLKVGFTARYLGGIGYLTLKGNNVDVSITGGSDTFRASNSDLQYASNVLSSASAINKGLDVGGLMERFFGSKAGSGFGGDVGLTYLYRLDDNADKKTAVKDNYLFKVGLSVTDIGAITYKKEQNYNINVSGNGYVTGRDMITKLQNYQDFRAYAVQQGFTADTGAVDTKIQLPTTMVLTVDYRLHNRLFVNATYIGNMVNRQNFGNSYYSQLTVTPRFESKIFSFGLPVTYSMLANDIKVGFGMRVSGFFFGSDDMLAVVSDNQHGFGFYFGGYVPIFRKNDK